MHRNRMLIASVLLLWACVGSPSPSPTPTAGPTIGPSPSPNATVRPSPTASPIVGSVELARSDLARATVDPALASQAADAINAFGLDLYRRLAGESGNIVLSPASVAIALSMARAGAVGQAATEMDAVLRDLGAESLADAANALDAALAARSGTFADSAGADQDVLLRIVNAQFVQFDMPLQAAFLDAMATRYGAGLWQVDYRTDPEGARQAINAWVAENTEDRIPEILKAGDVTMETRLALANAIYLKAAWLTPFDKGETAPGTFMLADGASVQVPLMHLSTTTLAYGSGDGWRAVELPYVGNGLAMTLIVPDDLAAFEATFDAAAYAGIIGSLGRTRVVLTMPGFDTESRLRLEVYLPALGMPTAFDPLAADFSGMTTNADLYIQKVIHQANITVDEAGTEAAAATVILMGDTSGPGSPPIELRVDRPFLFLIRDVPTGAVVFMGRVADPGADS